jgi:hypothetical protein
MAMSGRRLTRVLMIAGTTMMASTAHAQTATAELDLTGGYSREDIKAAATQLRLFGDAGASTGIQYFAEAAWGQRWAGGEPVVGSTLTGADPMGTDVFGAAYPYNKRVELIEAYAERFFRPRGAVLGVRGGQFRTPFGIYNRSDYGYSGFIRPPLIRYDGYFALSNNYLEQGAMFTVGVPQLFVETSIGRPHDVGSSHRRAGTDGSIRAQGYYGPFIVGVSHTRSNPYLPIRFALGRQVFSGVDLRWAHSSGVQLRGEFLRGRSFTGVSTRGWYVDGIVHHVGMGPFAAVVRGESLDYTAPSPRARSASRFTMGTRVRLPGYVTAQVNYMHQRGDLPRIHNNSVDFTVTYSIRYH